VPFVALTVPTYVTPKQSALAEHAARASATLVPLGSVPTSPPPPVGVQPLKPS